MNCQVLRVPSVEHIVYSVFYTCEFLNLYILRALGRPSFEALCYNPLFVPVFFCFVQVDPYSVIFFAHCSPFGSLRYSRPSSYTVLSVAWRLLQPLHMQQEH